MNIDDQRLAAILRSVGEHLETSSPVLEPRRNVRFHIAAFVAVLLATTTIAVPPIRAAIQRFLRIGNTTVEIVPSTVTIRPMPTFTPNQTEPTEPLRSLATGLTIVDRTAASGIVAQQVPALTDRLSTFDKSTLGVPDGFATMPEGGLLVIWRDGSTLWIHDFSVKPGDYFRKLASSEQVVIRVSGIGDDAIAIEGGHWLATPHRTVVSASTVLWVSEALEFRLESNRPLDELIVVAKSIAESIARSIAE
jgi:hypothetical protein